MVRSSGCLKYLCDPDRIGCGAHGGTVKVPYAKKWQKEADTLRKLVLDCDLTQEIKWARPAHVPEKERGNRHPVAGRMCALILQRRAAQRLEAHSAKDRSGADRPLD